MVHSNELNCTPLFPPFSSYLLSACHPCLPEFVMFKLWGSSPLNRREMIRAGGLSLGGLTLPMLLANPASAVSTTGPKPKSFGKAKNCIILYLSGGPAQLDTFDPKPDAPAEIRGEFGTIPTSVPG